MLLRDSCRVNYESTIISIYDKCLRWLKSPYNHTMRPMSNSGEGGPWYALKPPSKPLENTWFLSSELLVQVLKRVVSRRTSR